LLLEPDAAHVRVGAGSVAWMLMLAAVMAVEKNVTSGRQITRPLGASLLGTAALAAVLATA
jgi:predicted metal-binding membrane protein